MRFNLAIFKFLVVLALVLAPSAVWAQSTIGTVFENIGVNINPLPRFMVGFCYIMGIVALAVGLMKLRETIDDAGKNKIQSAAAALAVGALLIGLPYAIKIGQSLSATSTQSAVKLTAPVTMGSGFNSPNFNR
jgi:membrane associated rhomboid family serine protease